MLDVQVRRGTALCLVLVGACTSPGESAEVARDVETATGSSPSVFQERSSDGLASSTGETTRTTTAHGATGGTSPDTNAPGETTATGTASNGVASETVSPGFDDSSTEARGTVPDIAATDGAATGMDSDATTSGNTGSQCRPDCGSIKWACWPMPNPVGSGLPNPASYTVGAETTVDNVTCLEWQKTPPTDTFTWQAALDYCEALTLDGHDDWRLPTRIEMASIVDFVAGGVDKSAFPAGASIRELATLVDEARVAPAINVTLFPNTKYGAKSNNWYWASHHQRGSSSAAWAINFDDGFTGFNAGASGAWNYWTSAFVKCVR